MEFVSGRCRGPHDLTTSSDCNLVVKLASAHHPRRQRWPHSKSQLVFKPYYDLYQGLTEAGIFGATFSTLLQRHFIVRLVVLRVLGIAVLSFEGTGCRWIISDFGKVLGKILINPERLNLKKTLCYVFAV